MKVFLKITKWFYCLFRKWHLRFHQLASDGTKTGKRSFL